MLLTQISTSFRLQKVVQDLGSLQHGEAVGADGLLSEMLKFAVGPISVGIVCQSLGDW